MKNWVELRVIAFDVGEKYTGYAVSDDTGTLPSKGGVIEASEEEIIERIAELTKKFEAKVVVVGIPYTLKGEKSLQTEKVLQLVERLKKELSLPIETVDERLSTVEAERIKRETRMKKERKYINEIAARLILDTFLNMQKRNKG